MQGEPLIVGWPNDIIDNIPYCSNKQVFLHFETHQALHSNYVLEMRRRFILFLNAYYGRDSSNLEKLKNNEGVTHLIINKEHFYNTNVPTYFEPFNEMINNIYQNNNDDFYLLKFITESNMLENNYYMIEL
jgi:hypothetical protein